MAKKAAEINAENPNIAILNYKGTYTNELNSLKNCYEELKKQGEFTAGEIILGDVSEIECVDGCGYLDGKQIALIYNKFDQLQIDPSAPEIQGWVSLAKSDKTEFLNSLGAIYLGEAKRTLAFLSDPNWSKYLDLNDEEIAAINDVIPFTRLVEDFLDGHDLESILPIREKDSFVLKADALTRGSGIFIGDQSSDSTWQDALNITRASHGVAQLKCHLPSRKNFVADTEGNLQKTLEFFGVDVFLFEDDFAGLVSRSHTNQIFNVGSGGRESPVLIVGGNL